FFRIIDHLFTDLTCARLCFPKYFISPCFRLLHDFIRFFLYTADLADGLFYHILSTTFLFLYLLSLSIPFRFILPNRESHMDCELTFTFYRDEPGIRLTI